MNVSHTTLTQQVAALITEHDCLERKIILKKNTPKRCHAMLRHIDQNHDIKCKGDQGTA